MMASTDEQDRIIAEMVRGRRELRRSIACMEEQIYKAGEGFRAAAEAVRSSKNLTAGHRAYFPESATYPDIETFRALLRNLESAKSRAHDIATRLDMC